MSALARLPQRRGCQLDDVASSAPGGDAEVLARVQAQQPGDAAELGLVGPPAALMEGWDAAEVDVFRAGLVQLGRCFEDIAAALNSMVGCAGEAAKRARGMDTLRCARPPAQPPFLRPFPLPRQAVPGAAETVCRACPNGG